MEYNVKILSPEENMEALLALLEDTPQVPLVISGYSMTPFLLHGRDIVFLSKADRLPKRGDMVLYQRDSGAYVLHRVLRAKNNSFTMIGDAQTRPEPGIRSDQIRAVVTAVCRRDTVMRKGSFWWDFFEKVWIGIIPLRPAVRKVYSFIKRGFL